MTVLRRAQWFFTIFLFTSNPDNTLELVRLVSTVHKQLMANFTKLSRQDRQWQGIVFDFGIDSDSFLLVSQSSLTLALLRCIFTEGTVFYDGIPTNQINLDALRSSITIIPQAVSGFHEQCLDYLYNLRPSPNF